MALLSLAEGHEGQAARDAPAARAAGVCRPTAVENRWPDHWKNQVTSAGRTERAQSESDTTNALFLLYAVSSALCFSLHPLSGLRSTLGLLARSALCVFRLLARSAFSFLWVAHSSSPSRPLHRSPMYLCFPMAKRCCSSCSDGVGIFAPLCRCFAPLASASSHADWGSAGGERTQRTRCVCASRLASCFFVEDVACVPHVLLLLLSLGIFCLCLW